VEALNTPTIRRLTPSCRHQLPRIAHPQNKLIYKGTNVLIDLEPIDLPLAGNRKMRRAGVAQKTEPVTLKENQIRVGIKRTIKNGQIGVELQNFATFPLSVLLFAATTELAGELPPRTSFPKSSALIQPGSIFNINDDRIAMDGIPCGRMDGQLDMTIKYGLPGKERFELRFVANLDVRMEEWGYISQVASSWQPHDV
jgi:hypothetical protein